MTETVDRERLSVEQRGIMPDIEFWDCNEDEEILTHEDRDEAIETRKSSENRVKRIIDPS